MARFSASPPPCHLRHIWSQPGSSLFEKLREILTPHFSPGLVHRRKNGREAETPLFITDFKDVLPHIVSHFMDTGQSHDAGAHRVGTADSDEAPLLDQARNPKFHNCHALGSPS